MKRALLLLAACGHHDRRPVTVSDVVPVATQLVSATDDGVAVIDLIGKVIQPLSKTGAAHALAALPEHGGVFVLNHDRSVRHVTATTDRTIATLSCGHAFKAAHLLDDNHTLCIETDPEVVAIDVRTGAVSCVATACVAPPIMVKGIQIAGKDFALISLSPTKRWEVYQHEHQLVFVDAERKQRYAPRDDTPWPPALLPGKAADNTWPESLAVDWIGNDLCTLNNHTLVQAGIQVSSTLGSIVRW